jgi:hypothetical protein
MDLITANVIIQKIRKEMRSACAIVDLLHANGYTNNFQLMGDQLMCTENHFYYKIKEFQVDEIYRFDDESGTLNGLYLYALRHSWDDNKGIFIVDLNGNSALAKLWIK